MQGRAKTEGKWLNKAALRLDIQYLFIPHLDERSEQVCYYGNSKARITNLACHETIINETVLSSLRSPIKIFISGLMEKDGQISITINLRRSIWCRCQTRTSLVFPTRFRIVSLVENESKNLQTKLGRVILIWWHISRSKFSITSKQHFLAANGSRVPGNSDDSCARIVNISNNHSRCRTWSQANSKTVPAILHTALSATLGLLVPDRERVLPLIGVVGLDIFIIRNT